MSKVEKVVIVGSGPAGLTAAIYAARGNLNPLMVSGRQPGGQLMLTTDVDDFPGFAAGIQGPELMSKIRAQCQRFGTRFIDEDVVLVDLKTGPFIVKTEGKTLRTHTLIIATGSSAKWLGLPSEYKLIGKGVSACAVCDAPFFKNKKVMVVGGGDTAMREAQHLSKHAKQVTIVHRRDQLRAQAALQELVKSKPNIDFLYNKVVLEILGRDRVEGVKLKDTQDGKVLKKLIDGVFVAIGHNPNTTFLKGQLKLDDRGYIMTSQETKTPIEGVFAAGDVVDFHYRQAVTAAGSGCQAAMDAEEYLEQSGVI